MSEYIDFYTTLSNGQISKLKRAKKIGSSAVITVTKTTGPHKLSLTKTQIDKISKRVKNGKGIRIKMSETQVKNQTGGFLGTLINLAKTALPALATLGVSAASGAIQGATKKAAEGRGLYRKGDGIFPLKMNKQSIKQVLESIGELEELGIVEKDSVNKTIKEINSQNGGFIGTLLAGLAGSVLPELIKGLTGSGLYRKGDGLIGKALNLPNGKVPILGDIPILKFIF